MKRLTQLESQGESPRKTKGQQLKGKIVSALSHTFSHFSTLFTRFQNFSPRTSLKIKAVSKENNKKQTKPFCTLVVARLSSSKESTLQQNVVTILRRFPPPFPWRVSALFRYWKAPFFCGMSYDLYRISGMNPLFSPTRNWGARGVAKWWPSNWCILVLSAGHV